MKKRNRKARLRPPCCSLCDALKTLLDADAEIYILNLIAGVGIEVIRGAAVELIPVTDFTADDDAESKSRNSRRYPANGAQQMGFLTTGYVVDLTAEFVERAWDLHGLNHIAESIGLDIEKGDRRRKGVNGDARC
jgi:hypothetical protein